MEPTLHKHTNTERDKSVWGLSEGYWT